MRMRRGEKCIVPYCDEAEQSGGKPIYIRVTVDGKRTLKKVGAICKPHLVEAMGVKPESQYDDPDNEPEVQVMRAIYGDFESAFTDPETRRWLLYTTAGDVNFTSALNRADLSLLRSVLDELEDELRRGFPHKTRIKRVAARIRALEKEEKVLKPGDVLKPGEKVTVPDVPVHHGDIIEEILPRKKAEKKVHCDDCGCDNIPDRDDDGNVFCGACEVLLESGGSPMYREGEP